MFVCDECVVCCICKVKYNYKLYVDYVYACASCEIIQSKHWHCAVPYNSNDKTHKKSDEILCVTNFVRKSSTVSVKGSMCQCSSCPGATENGSIND